MISFCEHDGSDDTCNVQITLDATNDVKSIAVLYVYNQFLCLTNGNNDELFNFTTIDENTLLPGANDVEDEICEESTPSPTPRQTSEPTDDPTPNPTPRPTDTSCDYGFDVTLRIVVANGCLLEVECDNAREYLREVRTKYSILRCFCMNGDLLA